jgi:C1A family cysteine protease
MALRERPNSTIPIFEQHSRLSRDLAATLDYRPLLLPVRNQGQAETCVAEASACMKEYQERTTINLQEYMASQFIYNCRSNYPTVGMYLSDAMTILSTLGCPLEETYQYGTSQTRSQIPAAVMTEAANFKIASSASVTTSAGLQSALAQNGVCIISFPMYNNSTTFWIPGSGDTELGGHCVAVVGYTPAGFILRNSWGSSWGDNGYTTFPFSQWGSQWDCFTSVNLPTTYRPPPNDTLYVPPDVAPEVTSSKCCGTCTVQ